MTPGRQTFHSLPDAAGLGYHEYLPAEHGAGARLPLLVCFHGSGERGNGSRAELPRVLRHGPAKLIAAGRDLPAIVISPQTAATWASSVTVPFVDHLLARYDVDPDRIYVTGLSLGGNGAWDYARARRDVVAAIVPVCGFSRGVGYGVLQGLPIWTFHDEGDTIVPIVHTAEILEEITGVRPGATGRGGQTGAFEGGAWRWRAGQSAPVAGEGPSFTVYTGEGHDAWTPAYDNPALWDWLFAQRRPAVPAGR